MSWLKTITESIINEISADDAYTRFYSSIPREDYDKILDGDPAPDKFMQFILNTVRDGIASPDDGLEAVRAYKGADQLVKQKILQKFRNGEYTDPLEITYDVNYFSSGGAVLSRKKFAKEGYIKVKENERWLMTCTTNYLANNHYYGKSHWCTASDRLGRWDGWRMFTGYTDDECVLVQYVWKGKVSDDDEMDISNDDFNESKGYVGKIIDRDHSMFQAQVNEDGIYQICDFADTSMGSGRLKTWIGEQMFSALEDKSIIRKLREIYDSQHPKEVAYQDSVFELMEKKRQRKEEALRRKRDSLQIQVTEWNRQRKEVAANGWKEFCDKKMYENPETLMFMVNRDSRYSIPKTAESYEITKYAAITGDYNIGNDIRILYISGVLGIKARIEEYYPDDDSRDYRIEYKTNSETETGTMSLLVDNNYNFLHVFGKPIEGNESRTMSRLVMKGYSTFQGNPDEFDRFLMTNNAFDEAGNTCNYLVWDGEKKRIIDFSKSNSRRPRYWVYDRKEGKVIFFPRFADVREYDVYNENTGELEPFSEGQPLLRELDNGGVSFIGGNGQKIFSSLGEGVFLPIKDEIPYIYYDYSDDKPVKNGDVIAFGIRKQGERDYYNAIIYEEGSSDLEFLFGESGYDARIEGKHGCKIYYNRYSIRYADGEYFRLDMKNGGTEKCDKWGETESDRIRKKNFADWQAAGGHSPEAQAQMDKMWADRNGDEDWGRGAMKQWNDDDLPARDERDDTFRYDPNFKFNTELQKFDERPDWRGYMGLRDPRGYGQEIIRALQDTGVENLINGEIPDYVRRNPWYRINKQGKPIDQPWYDEDEVPANLSDRVVRENRIKKSFNKMKSIWDRMGLNDN